MVFLLPDVDVIVATAPDAWRAVGGGSVPADGGHVGRAVALPSAPSALASDARPDSRRVSARGGQPGEGCRSSRSAGGQGRRACCWLVQEGTRDALLPPRGGRQGLVQPG
jgi:hypothetical protein